MKPSQLTPSQIRQALINAKGNYARNERLMLLRSVARLWQHKQRGEHHERNR